MSKRILSTMLFAMVLLLATPTRASERDYGREQAAIHQATTAVAPSVVQIHTVGGFERIGETATSQGPTTGLIVSSDGYIVSSAVNFAQRPSSILVGLASGKQVPAELVARDLNRMLVLLKIETDEELQVPAFVPEREFAVGQWSLAVGRTFQSDKVDISLGIISALNRMYGRVVQTDANVSAANYGGPLVDIRGRVFGVLVPMSPQPAGEGIESEVAGSEYYDSGIGFAVPLEHVFKILDRWKQGEDLLPGKLGIGMKAGSPYFEPPAVLSVWPGSPAADAGWKAGDTIVAANGKAVTTQSQLQFMTKPLYAGDKLTVSLRRGADEKAEEFDTEITLIAKLAPYRQAFLGVLPDAPKEEEKKPGVVVKAIWPGSPAAKSGLQPGDRINKLDESKIADIAAAQTAVSGFQVEQEIEIAITRDDKEQAMHATLSTQPEEILSSTDLETAALEASASRELEKLKMPQYPQEAKYLTPKEKVGSPGLLIWLLEKGDTEEAALVAAWQAVCDRDGLVLLFARPGGENGWEFDDLEYLDQLARLARSKFAADPQRTIIGGRNKAGQLAAALGLKRREDFSGIVADNAPLPRTFKVPENGPGTTLAMLSIVPKNSTILPLVKHDIEQLREAGFPVSVLDRPAATNENDPLDAATQASIRRWIMGLKRL